MTEKNKKKYGFNFDSVTLRVKNMEEMKNFYLKLLKMNILNEKNENGKKVTVLGTENKKILTLVSYGNENIKSNEEVNVFHIAYLLPSREDLGNFLRNCIEENIKLDGTGDHDVSEAIYLTDPEGNG
ncbi:MAG: VOC family protein, partial [Leptotrichiaceae bacterium]|nr:VOC family protein [Leptotrichiaceae bacterium]